MQTGVAVSVPPMNAPPEIDAELHTGTAAEAGFAMVMEVTRTPTISNTARIFDGNFHMGEESTPKGGKSSPYEDLCIAEELRKCETSISRYSLAEIW